MVASVSPYSRGEAFRNWPTLTTSDVITSKDSTFPYDNDTMRRMIRLVQAAKGT